jgi:hypothetical protein
MSEHHDEDDHQEQPDLFKIAEKKTIDQYKKLGSLSMTTASDIANPTWHNRRK